MSRQNQLEELISEIEGIAIFLVDKDGTILEWNRACEKLYGYLSSQAIGEKIYDLILLDHQKEDFKNDLKNRIGYTSVELQFKKSDGSALFALSNSTFVGDNCYFMVFDTVSNKKERSIKDLVDPSLEQDEKLIVLSFDKNFKITSFNNFAQTTIGYKEKEILGRSFIKKLLPASHQTKIKELFENISKDRRSTKNLSFPVICKNGERKVIKWEKIIKSKKSNEEFYFLIGINSDDNQDQLNYLANYDLLTDLPNQTLLNHRLQQAIYKASRLKEHMVTLFLNIENFKSINHIFGFDFGNKVLKLISERLCSNLRDYDIVARFSGDEFVIIFENISEPSYATNIAQRVSKLFDAPFVLDENSIELKVNMGLSIFPSDGNDPRSLIKNANLAMNHAKKNNSAWTIFTPAISDELTKQAIMEDSLKNAIANEEFFLEYQPQVDANNQKIIGVEALIRWNHPKLKNIPPLDFIPLAEDTGLIHKIGKIVLRDALKQAKKWHDMGYSDLKLSVNISGVQLLQSDIVDTVENAILESGFNPKYLELELTETVLMQNIDRASSVMKQFIQKGIKFSIDDFGTGYSSFGYLSKLPVSTLKIDKTFIDHITKNTNDAVIVNAIISMSHSLDLNVIAEGVEKKDQYELLKQNGCDMIQGYYFGRPLSEEKMTKTLKDGINESDEVEIQDHKESSFLKEFKI
jgi:diguanylate cyclase (GGDEF)-like protein/PAS domain S-box-containing protein